MDEHSSPIVWVQVPEVCKRKWTFTSWHEMRKGRTDAPESIKQYFIIVGGNIIGQHLCLHTKTETQNKKSVRVYVKKKKKESHIKTQAKLLTIFTLYKQHCGLFQGFFEVFAQFRQIESRSCLFKKANKKQYMNLRSHPKLRSPIGTHNSMRWGFRNFSSSTFLTEWQEKGGQKFLKLKKINK